MEFVQNSSEINNCLSGDLQDVTEAYLMHLSHLKSKTGADRQTGNTAVDTNGHPYRFTVAPLLQRNRKATRQLHPG